jgi:hypothetical protein
LPEGRIRATGLTVGSYLLAEYPGADGSSVGTGPIRSHTPTQLPITGSLE